MKVERERLPLSLANRIARISSHGMVLVIMTFLGLYLGVYLDGVTGMAPNFTLVGFILGVALGFRGFIKETLNERKGQT